MLAMSQAMSTSRLDVLETPSNLPQRILVLAGDYREYLEWRQRHPEVRNCKFIETLDDIEGISGLLVDVVCYGNYTRHPLYPTPQLQALLAERNSPFRAYINAR